MGLFSSNSDSGLEQRIEKVTSDSNTVEDWSLILDVCDRIKESPEGPKEGLRVIKQKINNSNPRVSLQAITLLDACVNNCGNKFLLEVASREFEQDLKKLITSPKTHKKVADSLRQYLKSWAEGEFKSDRQLALIPDLYRSLRQDGYDFNSSKSSSKKKTVEYSNDPNVVNNKQEEDDIAQAIALSLQSAKQPTNTSYSSNTASKSLYGDLSSDLTTNFDSALSLLEPKETGASSSDVKKARALYDFEAVEDNELTFKAGELIVVLDSSDANWWKGSNQVGEGLFPANFVTLDINGPDQEELPSSRSEKRVSFNESVKVTELTEEEAAREEVTGEIDETKVDYLLHLLHESDPTGERPDPSDLPNIEDHVNAMAPTIDTELEQIDRKHNELSRLNNDLMGALDLYHQLMREMPVNYYPPPQQHPTAMYGARMPYPQGYAPPMHMGPGGPQGSPHHQPYGGASFPPSQPPTTQEGIPPHTMMAPPMHGAVPQHGHPMVPVSHNGSYPPTSVNGISMHPPQPPMMMMHQQSSGESMKNNAPPIGGEFYPSPHPTSGPPPHHGMYAPPPQGQPLM